MEQTRQININSGHGTSNNGTKKSNIYFDFKNIIPHDVSYHHSVMIDNAQIPVSFYNINSSNNNIIVSVNGGATSIISILAGNYNSTTLITELTTILTNAGLPSPTITLSMITGFISITVASGYFTFHQDSTAFKILGFSNIDNTSVAQILNAVHTLSLQGTLKLRISSYGINVNNIDSLGGSKNTLLEIGVNQPNFGIIQYANVSNSWNEMNNFVLDGFSIFITDDDGEPIDFNNTDWAITIIIKSKIILSNGLPIKRGIPLANDEVKKEEK